MLKVKLEDVIEQLEFANDLSKSYFNKKTGEIHFIPEEVEMHIDSEVFDENDLPGWEKEIVPVAKDILQNPGNYIIFPSQFDIHEYEIMERFCLSFDDEELREIMYSSIKGSGAFRRFKDNIYKYGISDDWFKYKEEAFREIAVEWCEDNGIEYY